MLLCIIDSPRITSISHLAGKEMDDEYMKCFQRVYFFLKLIGLAPDIQDNHRTILERICSHPFYVLYATSLCLEVLAELLWLFDAFRTGKSFLEITSLVPCLTLCLLSLFKSFCTLTYAHCINDLLERLHMLQSNVMSSELDRKSFITKLFGVHISKLNKISRCIQVLIVIGVLMFIIAPMVLMYTQYLNTGELEYILPFFGIFPFDVQDLKYYLCVYVHQSWTTFITVYFVYAPNYLYFTSCTFVHVQFLLLQYDMERVVSHDVRESGDQTFKSNVRNVAIRHMELIRCVELLDVIFSKSILLNALTGSIIICVTGFNVMINDNIVTMASFSSFLSFSLIQIFLYCYSGDNIMRSSIQVSDAIYNSQWYYTEPSERRSFLIILIRAQKPCKITAYNFFDINLEAFTSILSTSWSYFALLKTMYQPDTITSE